MSEHIRAAMQFAVLSIVGPSNETETAWLEGQIDRVYAEYMAKDVPAQPPMSISELADWCADERKKIDAYNPRSSEEYGLRRVEIELRKLVTALPQAAPDREAIAQVLLDRFIERGAVRKGGSTFPRGTKIQTLVCSYRDDFYADADAILALSSGKPGGVEGVDSTHLGSGK